MFFGFFSDIDFDFESKDYKTMFKQGRIPVILLLILLSPEVYSQGKLVMDESVYSTWNRITNKAISNNGDWVAYNLSPDNGDKTLKIYNTRNKSTKTFPLASKAQFTKDSKYAIFKIHVAKDTIKSLKREKVKKKDMPKDTLCIYNLETQELEKLIDTKSFKLPEEWNGVLAYQLEFKKPEKDTSENPVPIQDIRPEDDENGHKLIIRNLETTNEDTIPYVTEYILAKDEPKILFCSTGLDTVEKASIYLYDYRIGEIKTIVDEPGKYSNLTLNNDGSKLAVVANYDTTGMQHPPFELYYWEANAVSLVAGRAKDFVADGWDVNEDGDFYFSEDGTKLFFGLKPNERLQDTSLLEEEIVNVELWNYQDGKLYTQQEVQSKRLLNKDYLHVFHTDSKKVIPLATQAVPEVRMDEDDNAIHVVGYDETPYEKNITWLGYAAEDVYDINVNTGEKKRIATALEASARVTPGGKYFYWWNRPDTAWFVYNTGLENTRRITDNTQVNYFNELHDSPSLPRSYGIAGWTQDEQSVLIYDRYDIWEFDLSGEAAAKNLTNGRSDQIRYRYNRLDDDEKYVKENRILLTVFDEKDKSSGLAYLDRNSGQITIIDKGAYSQGRVMKAKNSNDIIYSKESFEMYPDILHNNISFDNEQRVSIANPQQKDYRWGTSEIFTWTNSEGKEVEGLLIKPEGFDPKKKYPLMVNFYEKSSHTLHRHRSPYAHRSTINYAFYANNGYVIFNPDVHYTDGYPGNSCYVNVISGIETLLKEGFIDADKIGMQGHSWGGYQAAYLLTKTNIFACAEAGAPVVNMVSAYGGIRWGSGMSRMFQYEKTQSRLGATLWERPDLYLENSPIFDTDKVETPVLIMHNDNDGAVPWYQGIEYFVALRRLNKPAWMLNYNDEPHWPLKWQNRLDFNIRMKQFFDHYLKDAPMPIWMKESIPAYEKGINLGYELEDESHKK